MPARGPGGGLALSYAMDMDAPSSDNDADVGALAARTTISKQSQAAAKRKQASARSGKSGATTKKSVAARAVLAELGTNTPVVSDMDDSELGTKQRGAKRTRRSTAAVAGNAAEDIEAGSTLSKSHATGAKRTKVNAEVIPETQIEESEVHEEVDTTGVGEAIDESIDLPSAPPARSKSAARSKTSSRPNTEAPSTKSDPALRRKLGDVMKKFEALETKYKDLKDLGEQGESTFDALKRQADEKSAVASELIASLKAELAAHKHLVSESMKLQSQVTTLTAENATLIADKQALDNALQASQHENKLLQAKLSASRAETGSSYAEGANGVRVPGSAAKRMPGNSSDAMRDTHKRQLKEDLYSDLTGLIVRDVKRNEEAGEDIYDCIQTGRNGTLHFHLGVANPTPGSAAAVAATAAAGGNPVSFEDAEFQYLPLLDARNDRDLLDILPDYLTEEICFPRSNAAKFYGRVVDCMTKKIEFVES